MSLKTYRLLLVEDSSLDQKIFLKMTEDIKDTAFQIDIVDSLDLALLRIDSEPFNYDAVVLDLSLPTSSGFETFELFHQAQPNTPCLVISGISDKKLIKEILDAGAYDYLVKGTFDVNDLTRSIDHAVNRQYIRTRLNL